MSTTTRSPRQRVGLVLAGLLNASGIPGVLVPTSEGEVGPPFAILLLGSVLGLIGLVATVVAWRNGSRVALRVSAGCLVIAMITSLPAFFVDVPALLKALVGVSVLLTLTAVVLMFSPARRPQTVAS